MKSILKLLTPLYCYDKPGSSQLPTPQIELSQICQTCPGWTRTRVEPWKLKILCREGTWDGLYVTDIEKNWVAIFWSENADGLLLSSFSSQRRRFLRRDEEPSLMNFDWSFVVTEGLCHDDRFFIVTKKAMQLIVIYASFLLLHLTFFSSSLLFFPFVLSSNPRQPGELLKFNPSMLLNSI